MYNYAPAAFRPGMAQAAAPVAAVVPAPAPVVVPGMSTFAKVATTLTTLAVLGSASYVGIKHGQDSRKTSQKTLGYVGGVGTGLIGLAAVAGILSLPTVVNQTLLLPFSLPQA